MDSPFIHEGTQQNFNELVLQNSKLGPVLVNFWNPEAGPCLRQYPLLDQLAQELEGRFLLVNVNTVSQGGIAREHGVTSVPTLKLFRNGGVQSTRHGYQDSNSLRSMLANHIARDSDQQIANALLHYSDGSVEQAFNILAQAAINDPENFKVPEVISKLLLKEDRVDEAYRLLNSLPEVARKEIEISSLLARTCLLRAGRKTPATQELRVLLQAEPNHPKYRYQLAIQLLLDAEYEEAMELLFALLLEETQQGEQKARKGMLLAFRLLKNEGPLVKHYRRLLQAAPL